MNIATETAQELAQEAEKTVRGATLPVRAVIALVAGFLAVLLILFVLRGFGFHFDPLNLAEKRAKAAETRAAGAEQSAAMATNTVHIIERYHDKETVVREKAEESAHAVEAIPSNDVPADVLGAWRDGLRNVRSATNDPGPR